MANTKLDLATKSKINHLFFVANKTTKQISDELNIPAPVVMRAIDRKNFYANEARSIGNSKEEVYIIRDEILKYFNIPDATLQKKSRFRDSLSPRQMAHNLTYDLTKCSEAFIGKLLGSVDRSTVNHSREKMSDLIETDKRMASTYQYLEETCRTKLKEYRDEANNK